MNCFIEIGDGENLEKCSICFGTFANAAFFIINLTNFIVRVVTLVTFQNTKAITIAYLSANVAGKLTAAVK